MYLYIPGKGKTHPLKNRNRNRPVSQKRTRYSARHLQKYRYVHRLYTHRTAHHSSATMLPATNAAVPYRTAPLHHRTCVQVVYHTICRTNTQCNATQRATQRQRTRDETQGLLFSSLLSPIDLQRPPRPTRGSVFRPAAGTP